MHVLVIAPDPVDTTVLRGIVGDDIDDARVLVVAPALNESTLAFWMSDSDEAIADAEQVGATTASGLRSDGIAANSTTGEGAPVDAVQDALATFPADQILIFVRSEPPCDHEALRDAAQQRFGVPVTVTAA
jgi:hypothetical protein